MVKKPSNSMLSRIMFLLILFGVAAFVIIIVRLFNLQVVNYEFYQQKAVSQQTREKIVAAKRGTIYDTNMKVLAFSASAEMVTIEPVKIADAAQAEQISRALSDILGMDYESILAKAQKKSSYEIIKRGVTREVGDQIRAFIKQNNETEGNEKINAIYMVEDSKRVYPYGNFASHVLGFVGTDNQGLNGIEWLYDEELTGTPGRVVTARNAAGTNMDFQYSQYYDAIDGDGLVLTIDETIQHFLEKNLDMAYEDNAVDIGVTGIVMDVNTGAILAMANKRDYDPNDPFTIYDPKVAAAVSALTGDEKTAANTAALQAQWRNAAVNDTYEPGSTFKIMTASMAMENRVVSSHSTFYCGGSVMIPGWSIPISCWKAGGHGQQTFYEAVQNSCNPAFIAIGESVGTVEFRKYFDAFGFLSKTGVDLPGESGSIFHSAGAFNNVELATSSFGQTFQITPIQLITAVSAVANGGDLMKPYVVKEMLNADGTVKSTTQPAVVRQVISEETARELCAILESVVVEGTGKNAYVAGFRVAGKTGTSEKKAKQAETGRDDLRIASFIGFAPADDPQVAVLVLLDEPTVFQKTGGITTAPVVGRIMADILPYIGVEAQYKENELALRDIIIPSVTGLTRADAETILSQRGVAYRIEGDGASITDQIPAVGAKVTSNAKVILYAGVSKPTGSISVPDLTGKTQKQVQETLEELGLYMKGTGAPVAQGEASRVAGRQEPAAGSEIAVGSVINVEFIDMNQLAE